MEKEDVRKLNPKETQGTESGKKIYIPKMDDPPVPEIQGETKTSIDNTKSI